MVEQFLARSVRPVFKKILQGSLYCLILLNADELHARDWSEFTSENFTIYSSKSDRETIRMARDIEVFRKAVLVFTGLEDQPENENMIVFLFGSGKEYNLISPGANAAGFYMNTWDGPRMIVGDGSHYIDETEVLFHEYFHYLLRERSDLVYPKWYDEGFAELVSAARIRRGKVKIGYTPESRKYWFTTPGGNLLSIQNLILAEADKNEDSYWSKYYATAWAFVHFLQLGSLSGDFNYSKQSRNYIVAINQHEDPIEAFPKYFGKSIEEMDKELERYLKSRTLYGLNLNVEGYTGKVVKRDLKENEQNFVVASLAWRRNKEDVALDYLTREAEEAGNFGPGLSLRAVLENHKNNDKVAADLVEKALVIAPKDRKVLTDVIHYYWDVLDRLAKEEGWDEDAYKKILEYSDLVLEENSQSLQAYRFVWLAHQLKGDRIAALKTMMSAYQHYPNRVDINFEIGSYLSTGPKPALAKHFLEKVIAYSHSKTQREQTVKIIEQINGD